MLNGLFLVNFERSGSFGVFALLDSFIYFYWIDKVLCDQFGLVCYLVDSTHGATSWSCSHCCCKGQEQAGEHAQGQGQGQGDRLDRTGAGGLDKYWRKRAGELER